MHLLTILAIVSTSAPLVVVATCYICRDGTVLTPYYGIGGCNIFYYACKGGYRSGNFRREDKLEIRDDNTREILDAEAFTSADIDGSGNYMGTSEDDKLYIDWFNNVITPDKIRVE
ncbi:uncharacterized protein K452DRAFT_307981 [Aplosporella prunicola CBS 121167]|uniref:Uncharacterized protein n=1 Tax=Aplosporella prunicola CBS 121167 TaxID=1176127 RepID=A0A6A6BI59_9PEZI|nr:uncharacterized protein K452DRAFT_307981 [Aplosporella prunicola CBS 121167]KAF2143113.1 hypothetical protein K452DRAFT_307981 [Aplosporella prunicola CBS 121167]